MDRQRYLKRSSLPEVLAAWLERAAGDRRTEAETIATPDARDRVTAAVVYAARSVPNFHCSAMDGIAVTAADTFGASETAPVTLSAEQYAVVDTGDPIPAERDAVIMIEDVRWLDDGEGGRAELIAAAAPWQHIRLAGEDLVATEMVLPAGHRLRAVDVAALLSCGVRELSVRKPPLVAVLPTGDELVDALAPAAEQDAPGAILETNSYLIAGIAEECGAIGERRSIVADTPAALREALLAAVASADVVAFNAGSSAGRDDYVPQIIAAEGKLLAHGVDIMPGKPVALGIVRGTPVLGIPGYPVSAWVVCEQFLRPLLHRLLGEPTPRARPVPARLGRRATSRMGNEEFLRVKAARVGEGLVAAPLPRGASLLNSVVRADGLIRIPAALEGLEAGALVDLAPLRPLEAIEASLLAVGSHDMLLDILSDLLGERLLGASLSSAHVGSLGGLTALKRGECHLAGTHLIDEETGEYNVSWVRRFFGEGEAALINLSHRTQGLILPPGNPRRLSSLADLVESGALFVNRQRGSGTRQLLDFRLRQEGLEPERINGYQRELFTHLAVAAAVKTGGAEVGLGILAAARALELDFVPIAEERYDMAIRPDALELPALRAVLEIMQSTDFRERVAAAGGYDLRDVGKRWL